jgi:hypothetical protein
VRFGRGAVARMPPRPLGPEGAVLTRRHKEGAGNGPVFLFVSISRSQRPCQYANSSASIGP